VTYRYDAQNRLVGFTAGTTTIAYTYDPEGRRASRGTVRYLYAMGSTSRVRAIGCAVYLRRGV